MAHLIQKKYQLNQAPTPTSQIKHPRLILLTATISKTLGHF